MGADRTEETSNLDQLLGLVRHRWWIMLACTAVAAVAALGLSMTQRKQYTASATLLFSNPGFDQMIFGSSFFGLETDPTRQAATNIDLVSLPTVSGKTSAALGRQLTPAEVSGEVSVSPAGEADVADVIATDPSPARAELVANTYAEQYILFRQEADRAKISGAEGEIQQQIAGLTRAQMKSSVGQSLINRENQLRTLASLQTGNAELVQAATLPQSPSSPRTKRNVLVGAFLGLLLGFVIAFLLERVDRRLRDPAAIEEAFDIPVLGAVPESQAFGVSHSLDHLPPAEAEAIGLLRARLRYFNVDRELRSLLVTSAFPGDGKTTIALRLAIAEATSRSSRVVLVEADLRHPTLARRLGIEPTPGLAEVVSRNVTLEEAIRPLAVSGRSNGSAPESGLHIVFGGAIPPNPAELIESESMSRVLSALVERFDLVLVDAPPVSVVPDAIPLMRQVSGVVVVGRIGKTTREAARHLSAPLAKLQAPTLGVVVNGVSKKGGEPYYDSYYRHTGTTVGSTGAPNLTGSGGVPQHPEAEPERAR
jgi:tyrosine-protein kinase